MLDNLYFARSRDGSAVKVGRSIDIPQRMAALRCPDGGKVELVSVFEGVGRYERTIHRALRDSSLGEEWFSPTPLLVRLMAARTPEAMLAIIGVNPRNLAKLSAATDKDRDDLDEAKRLVEEGKALRQRVLARLRQRRHRAAKEKPDA